MNYEEIITEIVSFAKQRQEVNLNGEFAIKTASLYEHFYSKYPTVDKRSIAEVIEEIDARGWLLSNSDKEIIFDPATFQ